jgi:SAM-dependent methyltransferase
MSLFSRLSAISRRKKLDLFEKLMQPAGSMRILDVGAQVGGAVDSDVQFIDGYPWKDRVSAVNLSGEHIARIRDRYPQVDARAGDARCLPWPDKHFDIVYSNAVIEHVGTFEDQKRMAAEVMRVGKRWFVTTPNRWYPFEFHLRLPLVTWVPRHGYLWCGRLVQYSHVRHKYMFGSRVEGLRLLSRSDLKICFPGSRIIGQRVTFMAETLIVVGGDL